MNRTACFATLLALATSCNALAVGNIAAIVIIDRSTGVALAPHRYHDEYWVAGNPGATYAIEIRNHLDQRLLAVTSVDGVNVISGATAGWNQTGYVFSPRQNYQITGWRKSNEQVAAFTFTASPNSYAARTGRPANVGIIGVALFRERRVQEDYPPPAPAPAPPAEFRDSASRATQPSSAGARSSEPAGRAPESAAPPAPKLGTGHGEREYSYVTNTEFERLQPEPNEIVRIRYDSFDNLVAMGIIDRPHSTVAGANPFPASAQLQFVPDPPAVGRR